MRLKCLALRMLSTANVVVECIGTQPSILALIWGWVNVKSLCEVLIFDFFVRGFRMISVLVHEYAHLAVALVVANPKSGIMTKANLLGNLSAHQHMLQLCPGMPCPSSACVVLPQCKSPLTISSVALAGVLASATILYFSPCDIKSPFFLAAFLNFVSAVLSDGTVFLTSTALLGSVFGCGNWGLLCPVEVSGGWAIFPTKFVQLLMNILDVVELRGAQAGGVCTLVEGAKGKARPLVARVVVHKRGNLAATVFRELKRKMFVERAKSFGRLRLTPIVLAQGHSRFGTSSSPAVTETHPHQWEKPQQELIWFCNEELNTWEAHRVPFGVTITHNGDFDAWEPYGEVVGVGDMGLWLARVLHCPNTTRGDSPKLCGVFNLLVTKGSWFRSVRLAYTLNVMTHVEQVTEWEPLSPSAPNSMPPERVMRAWAQIFHEAFKHYLLLDHTPEYSLKNDVEPPSIIISALNESIFKFFSRLGDGSSAMLFDQIVPDGPIRRKFVSSTLAYFFGNDMLNAATTFFTHAHGTFGVSVSSSAEPGKILLAAKGQPVSVGFDPTKGLAIWASEPVSLLTRWQGENNETLGAKLRLDMQDKQGEILEIRVVDYLVTRPFHDPSLVNPHVKAPYFPVRLPGECNSLTHTILLRGCQCGSRMVLKPSMLEDRMVTLQFATINSPLKAMEQTKASGWLSKHDPIAADISQIPSVLREIDLTWHDTNSLNHQSSLDFADFVLQRARSSSARRSDEIDLLVTGVEGSHWLGQQFVADIIRVFPSLRAVALSSNFVLGILQKGQGRVEPLNFPLNRHTFGITEGTVCLVISQSGTTYPTVWAARLLLAQCRCHVFGMSGHFDTVLGASLGQSMAKVTFNRRLFSSCAGVRPAEPSTLATVAMHHTLSHLLLACLRKATESEMNVVHRSSAIDFQRILETLAVSSQGLCGFTYDMAPMQSTTHKEILSMADKWASHLTEVYWATLWGAIYILVTVGSGKIPISSIWAAIPIPTPMVIPNILDGILYVFLFAVICMIHRVVTGRRLLTRFTSRTIVIVDACTTNYKLLRAYVSKLRALAFRFTTFSVAGQNGTDHFVHEMTHLTTSETLIAVGRPDGRLASLAATEASTIMSMQQAKFIKSTKTGIEAVSIGHNPWTNPRLFTRHVALPINARPFFLSETLHVDQGCGTVRSLEGLHPEASLQIFAAMREGLAGTTLEAPKLTLAMLKEHYGKRRDIPRAEARQLLKDLLEDQQGLLGIKADDVSAYELIPLKKNERFRSVTVRQDESKTEESDSDEGGSGTKSRSMSDIYQGVSKWKQFFKAGQRKDGTGQQNGKNLTVANMPFTELLTIVRGAEMKRLVKVAWQKKQKEDLTKRFVLAKLHELGEGLGNVFACWKSLLATPKGQETRKDLEPGDWRRNEAYRAAVTTNPLSMIAWGYPARAVFGAWWLLTIGSKQSAKKASSRKRHVIGSRIHPFSFETAKVLDSQDLCEYLYETRVASHERLISFFVFFHRMVKPISRVPFLGFDMDRTESRLRVASTPAPVAMRDHIEVEHCEDVDHCDSVRSTTATSRPPSKSTSKASGGACPSKSSEHGGTEPLSLMEQGFVLDPAFESGMAFPI